jgi:hypothetical protein
MVALVPGHAPLFIPLLCLTMSSIEFPARLITLTKVYGLFKKLDGFIALTAEQAITGLNVELEQQPDAVGASEQAVPVEAASIEASMRASAVRQRVGGYLYAVLESEFTFLSEAGPLKIKFGTRTGEDSNIRYMAASVIAQLEAIGIRAEWDATKKSVLIHS